MNLVSFALRRPISLLMTIVAAALVGFLAIDRMARDIFPDLGVPVLYVAQPYGGMDPAQMEGFIVNYYEYHFLFITGIEHVESKSIQGVGLIKLQFHPGTNMAQAVAETVSYVDRARAFMPTGTLPPFVMRFDGGSVPVGDLVFSSKTKTVAAAQVALAAATVERIKTLLNYSQIVAPFDGVVARRLVNRGDLVQAATSTRTTPLFTVQRIDTIRVFCDVPENDVPHLHIGDPAIVKPYGFEGKPFVGSITRFSLRLNPETRNMRTEIDLSNPEERLYPGMYAEVSLEMNRHPEALTVPAAAVGSDGVGNFVYTITNNRITRLAINVGLTDRGRTEVTAGLSKETPVVTTFRGAPPPGTAIRPPAIRENS